MSLYLPFPFFTAALTLAHRPSHSLHSLSRDRASVRSATGHMLSSPRHSQPVSPNERGVPDITGCIAVIFAGVTASYSAGWLTCCDCARQTNYPQPSCLGRLYLVVDFQCMLAVERLFIRLSTRSPCKRNQSLAATSTDPVLSMGQKKTEYLYQDILR